MSKFFNDLKGGLQDAIAHKKGKVHLRSEVIEVPEPPVDYKNKKALNSKKKS